ncbi:MAG TPA: response regulator [Nitrospirota bacterium]|nr:response regulator [Nitrospirota bacterium]
MKNILIVDDNTFILDGLATTFGILLRDYTILTAENGMQAVKIMESVPVDLVLTDLSMPVMDGYQLIEHTKKIYPHIPVFVMTGVYTADVAERLRPLGVSHCTEKPFDYEELAHVISHELEGRFAVSVPLTGAAGHHIVAR